MEYFSRSAGIPTMSTRKTLSEAIRQVRPFPSLEVEAALTLMWAQDRVARVLNAPLDAWDLSPAQYNALRILRGSPEGLQTHVVAERMVTRSPNVTRLIDKLEAKGYLVRRRCPEDRRVVYVQITERALAVLASLDEPMARSTERAIGGLPAEDLPELIRLLNQVGGGAEPVPANHHRPKQKELNRS